MANYGSTDYWLYYGRYGSQDTIRYVHWRSTGAYGGDFTETNGSWCDFYYPRHSPYKNIPSDDKINTLNMYWTGGYTDRTWALYEIILD